MKSSIISEASSAKTTDLTAARAKTLNPRGQLRFVLTDAADPIHIATNVFDRTSVCRSHRFHSSAEARRMAIVLNSFIDTATYVTAAKINLN